MKLSLHRCLTFLVILTLTGCQGRLKHTSSRHTNLRYDSTSTRPNLTVKQIDDLFVAADHADLAELDTTFLDITDHLLTEHHLSLSKQILASLDPVTPITSKHKKFNLAYTAVIGQNVDEARRRLKSLSHHLEPQDRLAYYSMLSLYHIQNRAFRNYFQAANQAYHEALSRGAQNLARSILVAIWHSLQTASPQEIKDIQSYRVDAETQAWLSLRSLVDLDLSPVLQNALLTKQKLREWYETHPQHPARELFKALPKQQPSHKTPTTLAVLLPHDKRYRSITEAIESGIRASYYQAQNPTQSLSFIDSSRDGILASYQKAQSQNLASIIGPLLKEDLLTLEKSNRIRHPVVALNFMEKLKHPLVTQFSLAPNLEIAQLAETLTTRGLRSTLIIQDSQSKSSELSHLYADIFKDLGGSIADTITIDPSNNNISPQIARVLGIHTSEARAQKITNILGEKPRFVPQRRRDFDSIFVASNDRNARQIIPILRYHFSGKTPIFSASMLYNGHHDPDKNKDLNGVRFFDTASIRQNKGNKPQRFAEHALLQLQQAYPDTFFENFRFYALGVDAYLISQAGYLWDILPDYHILGCSGLISKDSASVIQRQLQQMLFAKGQLKVDGHHKNRFHAWQKILQMAALVRD